MKYINQLHNFLKKKNNIQLLIGTSISVFFTHNSCIYIYNKKFESNMNEQYRLFRDNTII